MESVCANTPIRKSAFGNKASTPRPTPQWSPSTTVPAFYSAPSHRSTSKAVRRRPSNVEENEPTLSFELCESAEKCDLWLPQESASLCAHHTAMTPPSTNSLFHGRYAYHALYWNE